MTEVALPTTSPVLGVRAHGDTGLLVEVADVAHALALHAALRAAPPPGLLDLVPAARSVLVRVPPGTDLAALAASVRAVRVEAPAAGTAVAAGPIVDVPVVYDGADLASVAALTGLTPAEVVAVHTGQLWTVAFAGFAPGFGYLAGADARLTVPRLRVPRTSVPAGAVGLAGEFSGIYPRASPGGWQLIGRTDHPMWRPDRDPPAVLTPGVRVRFSERAS
ncbi:5-oxoprolinase subunit B family protein [Actinomycetospora aeridis]|uniref:Allophanate hydrolase subunit 1 n=1 Tax=Actinomycetospora aeridis TaxID=3129231 RepID=A0ABU8NDX3_9PSEU